MSFVPVTGTARFRAATPPREGVVEFVDDRRTVALPIRTALPILTRAHARDDLHPSVRLLTGSALLGLRLVAAGSFSPDRVAGCWRAGPLGEADLERVRLLARTGDLDAVTAEQVVAQVLDAVVDAMPRDAPARVVPTPARRPRRVLDDVDFRARLQERIRSYDPATAAPEPPRVAPETAAAEPVQVIGIALRVEADEEELAAGGVRLVLQVSDARNPLHVADAGDLWADAAHEGFGERARTHVALALRRAAEAWPVLDRLQAQRVPDQLTLTADELGSLLEDGVGALRAIEVDVLWPRSLGRDLGATAVLDVVGPTRSRPQSQEAALNDPMFGTDTLFAFRWQIAVGGDPLTEAEMEALAQSASPMLRLRGSWAVVPPSVARRARRRLIRQVGEGEALAAALSGGLGGGLPLLGPASPDGQGLHRDQDEPIIGATLLEVRDRLLAAGAAVPMPDPAGLAATLRDYQRQGLTWLAELTSLGLGACLADDMGLGKTITLIALHLHRAETAARQGVETGPTLVVVPATLLGNWEAEIARFAPGVGVLRYHGERRSLGTLDPAAGPATLDDEAPVGFVLTTYAVMRRDRARLARVAWGLVVADEAQHIKNARSSTARALREIPGAARVALTGTPVENDLSELWAILDWVIPGLLGSRQAFRKVWAGPIESGREPTKAGQFAELVSPFLLRRRKTDPGIAPELPAKTETDHPLSLTREQVVLYEAFVRDTMARIERATDEATRRGLVLALLTGLKQICNHPAHFLKQTGARISGRSEKIDLLDELLGTVLAEDGAALVFTQYVALGHLLEGHLERAGVPHQFLHGGTPVRARERMVERFQSGEVPVFLLSLKAGGVGLNLTRADHVIHVDRWWNPAVEDQATDRAHRIGQTKAVQVHRMITRGTIEERVAELLTRKRHLADAVLGSGDVALTALTELPDAELRDLVTLRRPPDAP